MQESNQKSMIGFTSIVQKEMVLLVLTKISIAEYYVSKPKTEEIEEKDYPKKTKQKLIITFSIF